MLNKRNEIVEICKAEKGYVEGTNNRTKYGEEYGQPLGAWCAKFVWWVFNRAGVKLPCKTTWCNVLQDRSKITQVPTVGAVAFFDWNGNAKADHAEIVIDFTDDRVITIGGNTGKASDRVAQHTYSRNSKYIIGYADYIGDPLPQTESEVSANPYIAPTSGNLRKGSKGEAVRWLQWELKKRGYDLGAAGIDGDFGTKTKQAVISFQKNNDLLADGICGKNTRTALKGGS